MGKFDSLYASSPVAIQNAMVSVYGIYWHWLRFGGSYSKSKAGYVQRNGFTHSQWNAYQQKELPRLLEICVSHVPYYRDTWSERQKSAALTGNLQQLPLLEKYPIRENPHSFCRDDMYCVPRLVFYTSGSTGTPIASIWNVGELRNSIAVREVRSANWAGVSFKEPRATFSGRLVEPNPESEGPFHRFNAAEQQVYFSAFHLKPENAKQYVNALWQHKIVWMTGYAVSYYLLATYINDQGLKVPPLKAVITTSEKLTSEMRKVMEQAFQCRIFEEYSTVENSLFASECEHGRLHVSPDVGIVEILRPDGSPCDTGEVGEVVTTCLMRTYQPMIRYRLGDLAAWDPEPCPCGRSMPVLKEVVGRIEDVVVGPDGRKMVRFHGIFVNQPNVIEGQIIQEAIDHIHVKVVPTGDFCDNDVQDIQHRIHLRLGETVMVSVEVVDTIPRTRAGKFQAVISKV